MKSWPNVASKQLQSRKKVQQKYRDIACKANFFPPYLRQATKIYVATSYRCGSTGSNWNIWAKNCFCMVFCTRGRLMKGALKTYSTQPWLVAYCTFSTPPYWCMKDCDKQRLQTTVSINLWKIFAGHTGDWFDVKTASICTTELWDALKSFILTSLKFKVAPYPIIVSLDTLKLFSAFKAGPPLEAILVIFGRRALIFFFVWKLLEKNEKWHHFCSHAQWWSPWRRKNVEKGHLAPSNLTFLLIVIDRNGFRRMKEEGLISKTLPQFF